MGGWVEYFLLRHLFILVILVQWPIHLFLHDGSDQCGQFIAWNGIGDIRGRWNIGWSLPLAQSVGFEPRDKLLSVAGLLEVMFS